MLNILIFSKDRACQLDALLKSLQENMTLPWQAQILYKASNEEYLSGYGLLKKDYSQNQINLIPENNFKQNMLDIISSMTGDLLCYMTDDDLLIRPVEDGPIFDRFKDDPEVLTVSLRLGSNINRCYAGNNASTPPPVLSNFGYRWQGRGGDWGYPMSLDGNIFNLQGMVDFLKPIAFSGPNELEGMMHVSRPNKPIMLCFPQSRLINIPANRVQDIVANKFHNSCNQKELNDLYLSGSRIDIKNLYNLEANTCHVEVPLPILAPDK